MDIVAPKGSVKTAIEWWGTEVLHTRTINATLVNRILEQKIIFLHCSKNKKCILTHRGGRRRWPATYYMSTCTSFIYRMVIELHEVRKSILS